MEWCDQQREQRERFIPTVQASGMPPRSYAGVKGRANLVVN